METYNTKSENHEVFSVNMTVDTQADVYSAGYHFACKSCQCHCRTCIGHRAPSAGEGILNKVETEKVLERLLAA